MSRVLAGPFCCMMLGDHGAGVIKVESSDGDETREYGPPFIEGHSVYYMGINRNKRSIGLDLSHSQGQEIVRRLVMASDVVVENFRTGTMERWGLGWAELLKLNPQLIYCAISGFGRSGPLAGIPGYDGALQAFAGVMSLNGDPKSGPTKVGVAIGDLTTGLLASQAILLALHARERTGRGQLVEASIMESLVSILSPFSSAYLNAGLVAELHGNSHPMIAPYDLLQTADRPIFLPSGNDRQWRNLAITIGRPELIEDPRFRTNQDRVANRSAMVQALQTELMHQTASEWCTRLWAAGVPVGPVNKVNEILEHEQIKAREMVIEMDHPHLSKPLRMTGIPAKLHDTPGQVKLRPPEHAEHSKEILREVGYSAVDVAALIDSGVVFLGSMPHSNSELGAVE